MSESVVCERIPEKRTNILRKNQGGGISRNNLNILT